LDLHKIRRDTPGTSTVLHLNNAGASLMPQPVINAMRNHLDLELYGGGYEAAAAEADAVRRFYDSLAQMLRTNPRNIAFATNATDAYSKALLSIPFEQGDIILTTVDDYVSNQIAFLQLQKRFGVQLFRAKTTATGGVDVDDMLHLIEQHQPRLVAVTHVPTSSGLVQPVAEIGKACKEKEIWYLVDACQSAGQMPLDVHEIGCDFLSATFRKFMRGPRGAGFLYASDRVLEEGLEPLFVDMRGAEWIEADRYELQADAKRFEIWERSYAIMLGAASATEYALIQGLGNIAKRVTHLADYTRQRLAELPEVRILDRGEQLCGIVTLHVEGCQPERLKTALQEKRINTSYTAIGSARLDFQEKGIEWALRISPHYYNTEAEIDTLSVALAEIFDARL